EILRTDFGQSLANAVANQVQHERIRSAVERQRVGPDRDLTGKPEKLRRSVELTAGNVDEPFPAGQLAKAAGLSVQRAEGRLERARELLRQTNMPILDVAIATGFTSHSYFAQSYRLLFGRPPSEERRTTY